MSTNKLITDENLEIEVYDGDPELASSGTEDGTPEGYQDDGDLS